MIHLIVQASKYLMIFLFLVYTFECFHVFKFEGEEEEQKHIYHVQRTLLFLFHFDAFLVLYITTKNFQLIGFYLMQVIIIAAIIGTYHLFYKHASELVLNNMCMLLTIGFVILTRISFEKAFRQFIFVCAGFVISLLIPMILQNMTLFRKLTWVYVIVGVGALGVVAIAGQTSYGAKLSLSIGPLTIQPSEFVKIIFVMFIASMLYQRQDFHQVMVTSIFSAVFVLMLVASKDLGGALLYFFTYLVMVYVATRRFVYFGGGILAMIVASLLGYRLFDHVQARVQAWSNPLAVIDGAGYQVCQSLFMVCVSCFFMIMNVAMKLRDNYYRLTAVGLGTLYALQVFLTIGGVIKFIPSTGVTLPLVSYGGSSLLSTMIVFGIIQGLYIMQFDGRTQKKEQKRRRGRKE